LFSALYEGKETSAGPRAAPPATLLQGSSTSPLATLAHSYTPICTPGPSPCIYKRGCPGPSQGTRKRLTQTAHFKAKPSLEKLVTPTTSTPVQDNISLISPLVFHLASIWAGTRSVKFTSRLRVLAGPKCRQLARQVGAQLRVGNTFPLSFKWTIFSNLFGPGRCSALGVSSSCPPMVATTWYSSPCSTTTMTVLGSPDGGELGDDISPWRKRNTRACPATLLAGGGGDGATMARQEAAPRRLSDQSEPMTPAPLRETCRVVSSHLGQRRVSLPSNVPTPGGLMTPTPLRGTCWALVSHLR
jgi:hypothetical protein